MIKGNCACRSIVKMRLLLYWEIIAHFLKCVCFESCDGFFVQSFEEDWPKDSEKWSWVKNAWGHGRSLWGYVCEERVNNSVDLLSGVLVAYWVGQISALVTVTHFCCNLLLQMLECYWACSQVRLACFLFETNQHFVGSARFAGLCFNVANVSLFKF